MQASQKVVSLEDRKREKEFMGRLAALDPQGLLNIPFDDVVQGLDSANDSDSDPIACGPRATVALKRLYAAFGIEEMPATLGELLGSLWYCKTVGGYGGVAPRGEPDPDWLQCLQSALEEAAPELVEPWLAHRRGDTAALRDYHLRCMPLARMAKHFDAEMGWRGGATTNA